MKSLQYTVKNSLGIHARPAALLAQACTNFKSAVMVECNGNVASGNNVLQILALHAAKGSVLNITADGPDEEAAIAKIEEVLADIAPKAKKKEPETRAKALIMLTLNTLTAVSRSSPRTSPRAMTQSASSLMTRRPVKSCRSSTSAA